MSRTVSISMAAVIALGVAYPAFAGNIYCTIVGAKQGKFTGDSAHGDTSLISVYSLTEELKIPFDAKTGQNTGRPNHSPLTIVKELDKASPQIVTAAVTNEALRQVSCTLYRVSAEGSSQAYYKITLTNAAIVEIRDSGDGFNGSAQGDEHEHVSFTYQKIEWTDLISGTTATDDWLPAD